MKGGSYQNTLYFRRFNNILSICVIGIALYILFTPFWPAIKFSLLTSRQELPVYAQDANPQQKDSSTSSYPSENRIVIPSAFIDEAIVEGNDLSVIDNGGAWRKNLWVESPEEQGNTIIVGHRFTYQNPEGAFYHLDKVKTGDSIILFWNQKRLDYIVKEIKIVPDTEISVENDRGERELTIYTCTPLLTATDRLVVIAKPI
jgi:LPXTG-site transpeptidase (sortase) family protein